MRDRSAPVAVRSVRSYAFVVGDNMVNDATVV